MGDNIKTYLKGIEGKGACTVLIWLRIWRNGKLLWTQ